MAADVSRDEQPQKGRGPSQMLNPARIDESAIVGKNGVTRASVQMPRDRAGLDAIEQLLLANCVKRGFGPRFEGHGMPDLGEETPDPDDLRRIANAPGVKILAHSVPRALLVEASEEPANRLRSDLKKWSISEEVTYSLASHPFGKTRPEKKRGKDPA